jgi:acyl-CoA hydrolase
VFVSGALPRANVLAAWRVNVDCRSVRLCVGLRCKVRARGGHALINQEMSIAPSSPKNATAPLPAVNETKNTETLPVVDASVQKQVENATLQPQPVSVSATLHTIYWTPKLCDGRGIGLAGNILAEIDVLASIASRRYTGMGSVTASFDAVHFVNSIYSGDIVRFYACVNRAWRTSLEVGVLVTAENVQKGLPERTTCHAYVTFVCRKNGKNVPVPPALAVTEIEKIRYERANERREARLAKKGHEINLVIKSRSPSSGILAPVSISPMGKVAYASQTIVERTIVVFPEHTNPGGTTFGGRILEFLETAAIISGQLFCKSYVLTASLDEVNFTAPTQVGNILVIKAFVSAAWNSSFEVFATVEFEDHSTGGKRVTTNNGFVTIVAVDSEGKKTINLPSLICDTPESMALESGANERRARRLKQSQESVEAAKRSSRRLSFIAPSQNV